MTDGLTHCIPIQALGGGLEATNEAFDFSKEVLPGGPLYCPTAGGVTTAAATSAGTGYGDGGKDRRKERDVELEVVSAGAGGGIGKGVGGKGVGGSKKAEERRGFLGDKR